MSEFLLTFAYAAVETFALFEIYKLLLRHFKWLGKNHFFVILGGMIFSVFTTEMMNHNLSNFYSRNSNIQILTLLTAPLVAGYLGVLRRQYSVKLAAKTIADRYIYTYGFSVVFLCMRYFYLQRYPV